MSKFETTGASRRDVLKTALYGGAAAMLPASLAMPAKAADPVSWALLTPGFSVLLTEIIRHHKLDEKNGFKLKDPTVYTSVATYYADFVSGSYDVCLGTWDTFAARYLAGVPIKLVCTVSTAQMVGILAKKGVKSVAELKGKTIAAPQSTGTYRVARAVLKEAQNFDLEKEVKVQNVTNPAASVALLRAGSVEGALSWEPNVTRGIVEDPSLDVVFNAGRVYKEKFGVDLPFFGVSVRNSLLEKDPKAGARVEGVFRDCIKIIIDDPKAAVAIVGDKAGIGEKVLQEALSSQRMHLQFMSPSDTSTRKALISASEFFARNKLLEASVKEDFFAKS